MLRKHYRLGDQEKRFNPGSDYRGEWIQRGESLSDIVKTVTAQYFPFHDELVDAIVELDDYWPQDGGGPLWDETQNYVLRPTYSDDPGEEWRLAAEELKHSRRFFSPRAYELFGDLFADVGKLELGAGRRRQLVVDALPAGTGFFRARVCASMSAIKAVIADAAAQVGPPPAESAKAGRMNAEGVIALYVALNEDTARAEVRPAIGNDVAVIRLESIERLKVLDFERLERATAINRLSLFQPDYDEKLKRHWLLHMLHHLVSQPVVPGREADYLMTQMMGEYLNQVHEEKFDGVKFSSVQHAGGTNVVLFNRTTAQGTLEERFAVQFVPGSLKFSRTTGVKYSHAAVDYVDTLGGGPLVTVHDGYGNDEIEF
ncbi:RES family NAD+ phosphorylase [Paraburkholderia sp. Ac-20340]|uniref:RES family NAD+ phosphorylase n=1 Tax=Paraburkholderia sp. Ac-20340 TaxID=2703888 RepID=UPI003216CEA1